MKWKILNRSQDNSSEKIISLDIGCELFRSEINTSLGPLSLMVPYVLCANFARAYKYFYAVNLSKFLSKINVLLHSSTCAAILQARHSLDPLSLRISDIWPLSSIGQKSK